MAWPKGVPRVRCRHCGVVKRGDSFCTCAGGEADYEAHRRQIAEALGVDPDRPIDAELTPPPTATWV